VRSISFAGDSGGGRRAWAGTVEHNAAHMEKCYEMPLKERGKKI